MRLQLMPILCEFRRQLDPLKQCPRCGWCKIADDRLCIMCKSEDLLREQGHPMLVGQDHRAEFENCYAPTAGGFQLYSADPPWIKKRKAPGNGKS